MFASSFPTPHGAPAYDPATFSTTPKAAPHQWIATNDPDVVRCFVCCVEANATPLGRASKGSCNGIETSAPYFYHEMGDKKW